MKTFGIIFIFLLAILTYTASADLVDVYSPAEGSTIYKPFKAKVAWEFDELLLDSEVLIIIWGYLCKPGVICYPYYQNFWNTTTTLYAKKAYIPTFDLPIQYYTYIAEVCVDSLEECYES
ncbi:12040_t:CDS:2, partial [Cetraspora pellucida]